MLYEIMRKIRNFFPKVSYTRKFHIVNGSVDLQLIDGCYYLIEGSLFNDGVVKYTSSLVLKTEDFEGTITLLAPPRAFLDLVEEIESFCSVNKESSLVSETFGNYSYTKATDSNGNVKGWESAFKTRLDAYRKL